MKLYYGLTNYHLLCSILHRIIYNPNEKAIFVASQGILKGRIDSLKKLDLFDEVYYMEDTSTRDSCFNILKQESSINEIKKAANDFVPKYEKLLPFRIDDFDDIYLSADHGVFGIYVLIKEHPYIYLEDGRGIYSNWKILDDLLKIKNPGIKVMSTFYKAYGKSKLIKKKYVAFDSQVKNYDLSDCTDFDVNILLDRLTKEQADKILDIFGVSKENCIEKNKNAIILTQRFSTYKMLDEEDCKLLYALLSDIFAKNCNIYLKPHPADKCNYNDVFKNETVFEKEMPSELIRYTTDRNFDIGICTYSSSINSLKRYINQIYDIDKSIVDFKEDIFKLYVLFELTKELDGNILLENNILESCFQQCYKLNSTSDIVFNFTNDIVDNVIIVKDANFDNANYVLKIKKHIENEFISSDLINKYDKLYMKINEHYLCEELAKYQFNTILPISKVRINAMFEKIK